MTRPWKSIARTAIVAVAVILAVGAVAGRVLSHLIDSEALRGRLAAEAAARFGIGVAVDGLSLSLLPPEVVASGVRVTVPERLEVAADTIHASPHLGSLLRGTFALRTLTIDRPRVQLLSRRSGAAPTEAAPDAAVRQSLAATIAAASSAAADYAPGLHLRIANGELVLPPEAPDVRISDIDAVLDLPPDAFALQLTCASPSWRRLALSGTLDPATFAGNGHLAVDELHPSVFISALLSEEAPVPADAALSFDAAVTTAGLDRLDANFHGDASDLPIAHGEERLMLKRVRLDGTVHKGPDGTRVELRELRADDPAVHLAGRLEMLEDPGRVSAEVTAHDVDIATAGRVGMLFGGTSAVVRRLFDVLRAGTVPQITVRSAATTLAELGSLDAITLTGSLRAGTVNIPGVNLELTDVVGTAALADGTLTGEAISARFQHSTAHDGALRLGFRSDPQPLAVEAGVNADAADLPPLLQQVLRNESLSHELTRFTSVGGTASGHLILGGTTDQITAEVDAAPFLVRGQLAGTTQPLEVEGGRFHYARDEVAVTDATITLGASRLSQISMRATLGSTPPPVQVTVGAAHIAAGEAYPWLLASGLVPSGAWIPTALRGTLTLTAAEACGPLYAANQWHVTVDGAAQDLDIQAPVLEGRPLFRSAVSLPKLHFARDPARGLSFEAALTAANGLTARVDLAWDARRFDLKRLSLRDATSDATLRLRLTGREAHLAFAGHLDRDTLVPIAPHRERIATSLGGDFRADFVLGAPQRTALEGRLTATDLSLPFRSGQALNVERLSLAAAGGAAQLDAAFNAGDTLRGAVRGTLRPTADALAVDLDVQAGALDVQALQALRSGGDSEPPSSEETKSWYPPWRGSVRVAADAVTYGAYTWQPVRATVTVAPNTTTIAVNEAHLCGIATPGTITVDPSGTSLDVKAHADGAEIGSTLSCLLGEEGRVTGTAHLTADIKAHGRPAELRQAARGRIEATSREGRIYRVGLLVPVLSVVNVATGSLGKVKEIANEGLPYDTFRTRAEVDGDAIEIRDTLLDGPTVKMAWEGSVNLASRAVNLTIIVAPLKSVDSVVNRVPVLGDVLGGTLVSIPVRVSGTIDQPDVRLLDPSAVGERLLGFTTRTLKLPLKLLPVESKK